MSKNFSGFNNLVPVVGVDADGLSYKGTCTNSAPSATAIVIGSLAGLKDDTFNNKYYMKVLQSTYELMTLDVAPGGAGWAAGETVTGNTSLQTCVIVGVLTTTSYVVKDRSGSFTLGEILTNGVDTADQGATRPIFASNAAPEEEVKQITDYVSSTGTFTVDAFSQVIRSDAQLQILHESLVLLGRDDANNAFSSANVVSNRDGSLIERTEFLIDALQGTQFRTERSLSAAVEENAFMQFTISLYDLDSGAIASASIDITGITNVMSKSTGGGAFYAVGITQPVFTKANGIVSCSYQFLAAEWEVGDIYRLVVEGITAVVDAATVYCPSMSWSNVILEALSLDTQVAAIQADIGDPSARTNLQTLVALLGNPDAAGKSIYGNIGDFVGQANLQTLLAALGIPDVAGKSLYTCLITDRLDDATFGLSALETLVDDVETELAKVPKSDAAVTWNATALASINAEVDTAFNTIVPASPTAGSINDILSKAAPGNTFDKATDSLEMLSDKAGAFTGNGGAAQADSVKASLDILHTSLGVVAGYIDTEIGTIMTYTEKLYDVAFGVSPTAGSLASFIATGGIGLGTSLPNSTSLYDTTKNIRTVPIDGVTLPVANTLSDILHKDANYTYSKTTDSLEGISDAVAAIAADTGDASGSTLGSIYAILGNPASSLASQIADILTDTGTTIPGTLSTIAGYIDNEITDLLADVGDASASTKGSIYGILGNPATNAINVTVEAVEVDTQKIYDASLGISPADGSLASFIATGGTALGTRLPVNKSLYDAVSGGITAVNRIAGKLQMAATTIDLNQVAASYTLFTGTTQAVVLERLSFALPNVNVSDDVTITSISIQTNHATPIVIFNTADGAKANLTAENQLNWIGAIYIPAGKLVQLTIAGGAADVATVCDVIAECRAVVDGGYLA